MAEAQTLSQISLQLKVQNDVQEKQSQDIAILRKVFSDYFSFLKQSRLDDLEAKKEAKGARPAGGATQSTGSGSGGLGGLGLVGTIFSAAVVAITAAIEAVVDYFRHIRKIFRGLTTALNIDKLFKPITTFIDKTTDALRAVGGKSTDKIKGIFKGIETFVDDLLKPLKTFFSNFKNGFIRAGTKATGIVDNILGPDDFKTMAGKFGARLKTFINGFTDLFFGSFKTADGAADLATVGEKFKAIVKPITSLFAEGGAISKTFKSVTGAFDFLKEGSKFMNMLGAVGRTIGRLAWPFTLMMGIIDTVRGAFDGYVNTDGTATDKFIGGLKGGIAGLVKGLVGVPLDLLKSAVSWIAAKLGFKDVEKVLDSFSFTDLIHDIVFSPLNILKKAVNGILDGLIAGLNSGIAGYIPGSDAAAEMLEGMKFDIESSKRNPSTNTKTPPIDASDSRYRPGTIPSIEIDKTGIANAQAAAMESQQQQQMASRGATANTVVQDNSTTVNGGASTALIGQGSNALDPRHAWLSPVG